jgi:phage recombination protein Bet
MSSVVSSPARDHPASSPPSSQPLPEIPKQTIIDYLDATGLSPELTEAEKAQFTSVCQAFGLNPWKREVYATVYGEGSYRRFSVIVGYEVYLKRAERTGRLDGWSSRIEGTGNDMKAIVEIHRRDWSQPLVHEVYFAEAVQKKKDGTPTSFWSKMPRFQLKKVCISQAFRLCFPDELGGLPYDSSELPDTESLAAAPTPPSIPPEPKGAEEVAPVGLVAPVAAKPVTIGAPVSAIAAPKPAAPQTAATPKPEPVTIRFLGHQDPYPEEDREALLKRLDAYLDDNAEAFTEKHNDWIMEKARKSQDREGVLKMLSYAQKVVKNTSVVAGASV